MPRTGKRRAGLRCRASCAPPAGIVGLLGCQRPCMAKKRPDEAGLAGTLRLLAVLPVDVLLPVEQLGNVDIHELRAAHEHRARDDLDAAFWQIDRGWFDAAPVPATLAHEVFDEVLHGSLRRIIALLPKK